MIEEGEISEQCRICGKQDKYKCPACDCRTCSLKCCLQHKFQFKCSGIRNQVLPIQNYTPLEVQRDYSFINETMRQSEMIQKKLVGITALPDAMRYKLLKHYARRQQVDVILAPKIMKKHRQNLSFYSIKDKQLHWCVELKYFSHSHICRPIVQTTTIKEIILAQDLFRPEILDQFKVNLTTQYLAQAFDEGCIQLQWQSYEVLEFSEQDEYKFKNQKKRALQTQNQEKKWITINPEWSVEQMIKGYTVFEFPTIDIKIQNKNE